MTYTERFAFHDSPENKRQQAGRAGRRSRDALAVLVAETFALDQYYVQNPNELHDRAIDELFVDLDSKIILEAHLHCAAFEMPLSAADVSYFGPSMIDICNAQLKKDEDNWYGVYYNGYQPFHPSSTGITQIRSSCHFRANMFQYEEFRRKHTALSTSREWIDRSYLKKLNFIELCLRRMKAQW